MRHSNTTFLCSVSQCRLLLPMLDRLSNICRETYDCRSFINLIKLYNTNSAARELLGQQSFCSMAVGAICRSIQHFGISKVEYEQLLEKTATGYCDISFCRPRISPLCCYLASKRTSTTAFAACISSGLVYFGTLATGLHAI